MGLFGAGAGLEERPPLPPRDRGILVILCVICSVWERIQFNEDMETTEKLMVDVKFPRRGKTKRVSKLCTSSSEFLLNYKYYACSTI